MCANVSYRFKVYIFGDFCEEIWNEKAKSFAGWIKYFQWKNLGSKVRTLAQKTHKHICKSQPNSLPNAPPPTQPPTLRGQNGPLFREGGGRLSLPAAVLSFLLVWCRPAEGGVGRRPQSPRQPEPSPVAWLWHFGVFVFLPFYPLLLAGTFARSCQGSKNGWTSSS